LLEEITSKKELAKYTKIFQSGEYLFFEGDESQGLYVLVSGHVEILIGTQKLGEMSEPGTVFGELSLLLGTKRTASIRAENEVKVLFLPRDQLTTFFSEYPSLWRKISTYLAQRLDETSQALSGLKNFCDKIPDAMMMVDGNGKIRIWNAAAEKLYGMDWHQMHERSAEDIYEDPNIFRRLLEEVQSKYAVKERVLKIRHPQTGDRYISTSITALYDPHRSFQGYLSVGRDVTRTHHLEKKYQRARRWLIPSIVMVALLGAAVVIGYRYFLKNVQITDIRKVEVSNQLAKDYFFLDSLLAGPFRNGNRAEVTEIMKQFFHVQNTVACPYSGLILLDKDKKVFASYIRTPQVKVNTLVGDSYSSIEFQGSEDSVQKVLRVYRTDKEHPMGREGIEIAFELKKNGEFLGWLLFQMDMACLASSHGVDENDLKNFQIRGE
jgi:CRP/FNR family cyclic AMP-dependent transcriptional regulator